MHFRPKIHSSEQNSVFGEILALYAVDTIPLIPSNTGLNLYERKCLSGD